MDCPGDTPTAYKSWDDACERLLWAQCERGRRTAALLGEFNYADGVGRLLNEFQQLIQPLVRRGMP